MKKEVEVLVEQAVDLSDRLTAVLFEQYSEVYLQGHGNKASVEELQSITDRATIDAREMLIKSITKIK